MQNKLSNRTSASYIRDRINVFRPTFLHPSYRTNIHHTLKRKPLRLEDLREFINLYSAKKRKESERWKKFTYKKLTARDKTSLDLFWLKDDSLADLDNLPEPHVIAEEIIENIEAGLNSFRAVAASLGERNPK